jgi:uncharacterized protein YcaQ
MNHSPLTIDKITQRRFILGQQGLYPGRRYRGPAGAAAAIQAGAVVQVDPLNVIARNHDLALFGRVLDYSLPILENLQFEQRQVFDYGGTVFMHPMRELPHWRIVMARKAQEPRRQKFVSEFAAVVDEVYQAIAANGPMLGREFSSEKATQWTYRSRKASGQALYHLWISGELMTHSRVHFQRRFDLRSRIAPPELDFASPVEQAEAYFARRLFHKLGLVTERGFRNWWQGDCERPISPVEAHQRLEHLLQNGEVVPVILKEDPKTPRYVLAEYLLALEILAKGELPAEWQPLETTTRQEMVPLAPLEICTARGRAKPLFGFDYVWEVYKPAELRRWGYYTLPLLYDDRLAGRLDARVQRAEGELHLLGLWVEPGETVDEGYRTALAAGLRRLMRMVGVEKVVCTVGVPGTPGVPPELAGDVEERCK